MFLIELELVKGTEKEMHPHFKKKKKETQNISASPVSSPSCGWTPAGLGLILVLLCSLRELSIKLPALHQLWNKQERRCQMQNKTFDLEFDQVGNERAELIDWHAERKSGETASKKIKSKKYK